MSPSEDEHISRGDAARAAGETSEAARAYLAAALHTEAPPAGLCVKLARALYDDGDIDGAHGWLLRVVEGGDDFRAWHAAAAMFDRIEVRGPRTRRTARLALLSTHNSSALLPLLRLACASDGIQLTTYEASYGQYHQELLDPRSGLAAFDPDMVLLVPHTLDIDLPAVATDPDALITAEVARWTGAWDAAGAAGIGHIVQHLFVAPVAGAVGHLGVGLPGSDVSIIRSLNERLARAAVVTGVAVVDVDAVASSYGKQTWTDDRFWYAAKQSVAMGALPLLARHTAAVLAAVLGLARKCLVVDLDNTLWGGVIGEDGLSGITLGAGPDGEAFIALQHQLKRLSRRGVVLAVASKNDDAVAREPFLHHPDMVLSLDDFAAFHASWESKPDSVRRIAEELGLGLDAISYLDDNPVERQAIRHALPEVDVVALPRDPTGYPSALASHLKFQTSAFTDEDRNRAQQYRARGEANELAGTAGSLEEFQRSLAMTATLSPIDEVSVPRVVQLLGKTNQFNLTTRRHDAAEVRAFTVDAGCAHLTLRLADRFTDHGLVAVVIGIRDDDVLEIDTLAMSCRVIGRGAEVVLVEAIADAARSLGCRRLRGRYVPTARNRLVERLFADLGFDLAWRDGDSTIWEVDVCQGPPVRNAVMDVIDNRGEQCEPRCWTV